MNVYALPVNNDFDNEFSNGKSAKSMLALDGRICYAVTHLIEQRDDEHD